MSTVRATNFQNAGSASVNMTLDTAGNATVANTLAMGSSFLRNRIINGAMVIDQRNAGASVTASTFTYPVDRFFTYRTSGGTITVQQSSVAPTGFSNSILFTATSASSATAAQQCAFSQRIEGFNTSDLAFGTSDAATITLSFWVRSSLTGTYGVYFTNSAYNRSYVSTYSISSANTWEYKTVTITGDTSGTWVGSTNGIGLAIGWSLGSGSNFNTTAGSWQSGEYQQTSAQANWCGTSGATFYITGVQLESGTVATPFERRQIQQEVALCQRYFAKTYPISTAIGTANTSGAMIVPCFGSMAYAGGNWWFPVTMRANPTITVYSAYTGTVNKVSADAVDGNGAAASIGDRSCSIYRNNDSAGVAVNVFITAHATANAEL